MFYWQNEAKFILQREPAVIARNEVQTDMLPAKLIYRAH
jgi:hypothetical protein